MPRVLVYEGMPMCRVGKAAYRCNESAPGVSKTHQMSLKRARCHLDAPGVTKTDQVAQRRTRCH